MVIKEGHVRVSIDLPAELLADIETWRLEAGMTRQRWLCLAVEAAADPARRHLIAQRHLEQTEQTTDQPPVVDPRRRRG